MATFKVRKIEVPVPPTVKVRVQAEFTELEARVLVAFLGGLSPMDVEKSGVWARRPALARVIMREGTVCLLYEGLVAALQDAGLQVGPGDDITDTEPLTGTPVPALSPSPSPVLRPGAVGRPSVGAVVRLQGDEEDGPRSGARGIVRRNMARGVHLVSFDRAFEHGHTGDGSVARYHGWYVDGERLEVVG
jgi:hypothetical protein